MKLRIMVWRKYLLKISFVVDSKDGQQVKYHMGTVYLLDAEASLVSAASAAWMSTAVCLLLGARMGMLQSLASSKQWYAAHGPYRCYIALSFA